MDYKSDPENIGKWEKFFKWVNGEESLESVWEKEFNKRILGKRKKRRENAQSIMERVSAYGKYIYRILAVLITVIYIGILLYTASLLPEHGNPSNPANNEVSQRYIENGTEETGALNIVSAMILDYRAFDTFGETVVLFVSVMSVAILLKRDKNNISPIEDEELRHEKAILDSDGNPIAKFVSRLVVPIITLYGTYVIFNGHISPGGGFSGGTIIGAGLILYSAAYGEKTLKKFINQKTFTAVMAACLLIYFFSKGYSFFTGGNHIESLIPNGTPGNILSGGLILPLNICVGIIVACTMYGFYSYFTRGDI